MIASDIRVDDVVLHETAHRFEKVPDDADLAKLGIEGTHEKAIAKRAILERAREIVLHAVHRVRELV
ncbi:MAG: hypothetical protein ACHQY2_06105 [Candidatus Eremiobacterales bacterium]